MTSMISVKVTGLKELERKLGPQLVARPVRNFMNRGTITIQGNARKRAPIDRGQLRNKITTEVNTAFVPRWGRTGTNLIYAEPQELGTKPYWTPKAPLAAWGRRKGLSPRQVYFIRKKIARVGIAPKLYLTNGTNDSLTTLRQLLVVMAREIEQGAAQ